jgi:hypothetical protein
MPLRSTYVSKMKPAMFAGFLALSAPALALEADLFVTGNQVCLGACSGEGALATAQTLTGGTSKTTCKLETTPTLAKFSVAAPGNVGYNTTSFGKHNPDKGGDNCVRTEKNDVIEIALGTLFATDEQLQDLKIVRARVPILVRDGLLGLQINLFEGNVQVGTHAVTVGTETNAAADSTTICEATATICEAEIEGKWDRMTFEASTGAGGTPGNFSIGKFTFTLSDSELFDAGALACGASAILQDDDRQIISEMRRINDTADDKSNECGDEPVVPYVFTYDGKTMRFLTGDIPDDPTVYKEPAFELNVTWEPEAIDVTDAVRATEVGNSVLPDGFMPLSQQQFYEGTRSKDFEDADPKYYFAACQGHPVYIEKTVDNKTISVLSDLVLFPATEEVSTESEDDGDSFKPLAAYDMSTYFEGTQYGCYLNRTIQILEPAMCGLSDDATDPKKNSSGKICVQRSEHGYVRGDFTLSKSTFGGS